MRWFMKSAIIYGPTINVKSFTLLKARLKIASKDDSVHSREPFLNWQTGYTGIHKEKVRVGRRERESIRKR